MQEFMIIIIQDRVYDILVKDFGLGIEQSVLKFKFFYAQEIGETFQSFHVSVSSSTKWLRTMKSNYTCK